MRKLKFIKEQLIDNEATIQGACTNWRYSVWEEELLIGQYYICDGRDYFAFDDWDIRIDYKWRFFTSTHTIINQQNNEIIGHYKPKVVDFFNSHYIGKLFIDEQTSTMTTTKSAVKWHLLKPATWGWIGLELKSDSEIVVYDFKRKRIKKGVQLYEILSGEITVYGDGTFLLFAGFYLVEKHLNYIESSG